MGVMDENFGPGGPEEVMVQTASGLANRGSRLLPILSLMRCNPAVIMHRKTESNFLKKPKNIADRLLPS